jgi:hypothetical protein
MVLVKIYITDNIPLQVLKPLMINGESIWCYSVKFGIYTAVYAITSLVSNFTPKTCAQVGAMLGGNMRTDILGDENVDFYSELDPHKSMMTPDLNREDIIRQLVGAVSNLKVEHITQDHHLFIGTKELELALIASPTEHVLRCIACHEWLVRSGNEIKVSHITFLMFILLGTNLCRDMITFVMSCCDTVNGAISLMKKESQAAKQLQRYKRDDLSVIFELQVLWNRMDSGVDWEKEIRNRLDIKTVPIDPNIVRKISRYIFTQAEMEGHVPRSKDWQSYWSLRWSNMPNGSVVSQYEEDLAIKRQLPREAKVKSAWFSAIDRNSFKEWITRFPSLHASTSTKYEWGKVRALYGCDVTSFELADFSMGDADECLPLYFPVGTKANEKYVKALTSKMKYSVPFCFDYDDFNSQHSKASMQAVVDAWADVFGKYLSEEQIAACKWTSLSIENMSVKYNDLKKNINIAGTLMSGWRLTSFINTVLNRVYLEYAGLQEKTTYAIHNGDDMFAIASNIKNCTDLLANTESAGIRAQASKMNIGSIGEFLRVDGRATKPSGAQYLTRSIATMVHGRVEVGKPNDCIALLRATDCRFSEVADRGGNENLLRIVKEHVYDFIAELFNTERSVLDLYHELHPLQGGCDTTQSIKETRLVEVQIKTEVEELYRKYALCRKGIDEYFDYIVARYRIKYEDTLRKDFQIKAFSSLERKKKSYKMETEDRENIRIYRGLYRAWHKTNYVAEITRVRTAGLVAAKLLPGVDSTPAHLIRCAREPIEFMKVIL